MSKETLRRRVAVAMVAVVTLAVPLLGTAHASADTIGDKRAEAAKVTDQLEALQQQAEVVAEQYNDAKLALATVDAKAAEAKARAARTQAKLASSRKEMSGFAIDAYVRGGTSTSAGLILSSQHGTDIPERRGYAAAATDNGADVIDRLRAATGAAKSDTTNLRAARAKVAEAKALVDAKRAEANAAVDAQAKIVSRVKGELAGLVRAEQARRAAEAARKARVEAARFAAQQRAWAAAHPQARPTASQASTGTTSNEGGASADAGDSSSDDTGASSAGDTAANPPVGEGADAAIAAARSVLGVRYTWGGASPSGGFDCSGLVMWAWQHGGKSLPHSSAAMYGSSRRIPVSDLQPGDLVFYGSPVHHVALYIGGGQIIHAPHTGSYVQVASMYYWSDMAGAGRV